MEGEFSKVAALDKVKKMGRRELLEVLTGTVLNAILIFASTALKHIGTLLSISFLNLNTVSLASMTYSQFQEKHTVLLKL